MESLFFELGLVIISASLVGIVGYFLKQPLILAYIAAGILIGPFGFGLISDIHTIEVIADVGIMLMLFLVGLEMNPSKLKDLGVVAFATGLGQIAFTGLVSFGLALAFGFEMIESIYLAIILTFSSTVIAVKILYDKHDNSALYGQVAISMLLVQDIVAVLALLALTGFSEGVTTFDYAQFGGIFFKGVLLALAVLIGARPILSRLYSRIAGSHELLILFSLSWCFLVALISGFIGFSIEIGAFIAGVSLASLPYTYEINARAKILRDFFITVFFVALGAGMVFDSLGPLVPIFLAFSLFIIIGNPLIVMAIMGFLGYDKRNSFFTGLSIANISEFSLIVAAMGISLRHIDQDIFSMVTLIAVVTMTLSSYMMVYNNQLYRLLKPYLGIFERKAAKENLRNLKTGLENHIILMGCGQMGSQILEQVKNFKESYVVVDHDNSVIKKLIKNDVSSIFGDVEDADLLNELNLHNAEIIFSTLPNADDNRYLIEEIEKLPEDKRPIVIVTADSGRQGMQLFNAGADYVILKPYLGAAHIHEINKELYELEDEIANPKVHAPGLTKKFRTDSEYANLLHNLNRLRLAEIKQKLAKRHIAFTPKSQSQKKK